MPIVALPSTTSIIFYIERLHVCYIEFSKVLEETVRNDNTCLVYREQKDHRLVANFVLA